LFETEFSSRQWCAVNRASGAEFALDLPLVQVRIEMFELMQRQQQLSKQQQRAQEQCRPVLSLTG